MAKMSLLTRTPASRVVIAFKASAMSAVDDAMAGQSGHGMAIGNSAANDRSA